MLRGLFSANSLAAIATRFALVVVLVFINAFFVRARDIDPDDEARVRVTFPFDNDELRSDYMSNRISLDILDSLLSNSNIDVDVEIVSYSSPEGNEAYNLNLSKRRAASVKDYILSSVTESNVSFRIASYAESWAQFRTFIVADKSLSEDSRSELLLIVDSDNKLDEKEALIKSDPNYKALYRRYFRSLRYADISLRIKNLPVIVDYHENSEISESERVDTLPKIERLPGIRTKAVRQGESSPTERDSVVATQPQKYEWEEVPVIAISSNLLYDIAATPNFAVEVPLGEDKKWSVYAEYTFPWWLPKSNEWCYEMLKWDLGVRYHFKDFNREDPMDLMTGHFVGLDLSAGYYDFEPMHHGWQGEFQLVGLEYGYSWKLNDHWRLDAAIGAGYMATHYRYYEADATDQHLIYQHHGRLDWFGPTKAEIGLKYIVTHKQRRAVK